METITKEGVVTAVDEQNVTVRIQSCSACGSCAAKGLCGMSEAQDKNISVSTPKAQEFATGEEVILTINALRGLQAVFFSYGLPLILLLSTVITAHICGADDFYSGICGIFILIPYYLAIFLMKNKIKKEFQFEISKKTYFKDATLNG